MPNEPSAKGKEVYEEVRQQFRELVEGNITAGDFIEEVSDMIVNTEGLSDDDKNMVIKHLELEIYQMVGELEGRNGEEDHYREQMEGESEDIEAELEAKFHEFRLIFEKLKSLVSTKIKEKKASEAK